MIDIVRIAPAIYIYYPTKFSYNIQIANMSAESTIVKCARLAQQPQSAQNLEYIVIPFYIIHHICKLRHQQPQTLFGFAGISGIFLSFKFEWICRRFALVIKSNLAPFVNNKVLPGRFDLFFYIFYQNLVF